MVLTRCIHFSCLYYNKFYILVSNFLAAFTILCFSIAGIAALIRDKSTVLAVLFGASRFEVEFGLRRWAKKHKSTACSGDNRLLLSVRDFAFCKNIWPHFV